MGVCSSRRQPGRQGGMGVCSTADAPPEPLRTKLADYICQRHRSPSSSPSARCAGCRGPASPRPRAARRTTSRSGSDSRRSRRTRADEPLRCAVSVTRRADPYIPYMVGSTPGGMGVCLGWRPPGRSRGMGVCSERSRVTLSYPTPPGTEILGTRQPEAV